MVKQHFRVSDPVFDTKNGSGALYLEGRFKDFYLMNILCNFKGLDFCLNTFGVKRSVKVSDPENQPGAGKIQTGAG